MAMKMGMIATWCCVFAIHMATGNEEDASLIQTKKIDNSVQLDEHGTLSLQGICVPSTPTPTKWTGYYMQKQGGGYRQVPMNFDLTFNPNGQLSGSGRDVGGYSSPFKWSGTYSGNTMNAVKTYDDRAFIWNYKGQVTAQSGSSTTWSGRFYDMTGKYGAFSADFKLTETSGKLKMNNCPTPTPPAPPPTPTPPVPTPPPSNAPAPNRGDGICVPSTPTPTKWSGHYMQKTGSRYRQVSMNFDLTFNPNGQLSGSGKDVGGYSSPFKWSGTYSGNTMNAVKTYDDRAFIWNYKGQVTAQSGSSTTWSGRFYDMTGKYAAINADFSLTETSGKLKMNNCPTPTPPEPPPTAAPKPSDDDSYHQTDPGAESCPGAALTSTECKKAAAHYGKPWDRVDSWSNGPSGCFTNGKSVYFNTHKSGPANAKWSLICHVAAQAQCKGGCYNGKGVMNQKKCGEAKCDGCCECTGECAPTPPPTEMKCDDSCYTKKGNLNPSKQCSKDKCNGCCECTGECQDWDDLDDDEKGNEIDDEHRPEYECAKWCYSEKHKSKSWEKKCTWFACSTCPECPLPEEEPQCDDDACYNAKNGNFKQHKCSDMKCAACSECGKERPDLEPQCDDDACYNANNGNFKQHKCSDMKCAACSECGKERPEKELKCDDSCFKKKGGGLKPNICLKTKCAGCSGCGNEEPQVMDGEEPQLMDGEPQLMDGEEPQISDGTDQCTKTLKFCKSVGPQDVRATCCLALKGKAICLKYTTATIPARDTCVNGGRVWCNSAGRLWKKSSTKLSDFSEWGVDAETKTVDC